MTDSRVASLAALLRDFEDFLREELSLPRFREAQSHLAGIRNAVGSRLGEPSPKGPWIAFHALHGRWYVELEDGDYGSRERLGPFSELEAIAVRDALNLVRQTTQNDR